MMTDDPVHHKQTVLSLSRYLDRIQQLNLNLEHDCLLVEKNINE